MTALLEPVELRYIILLMAIAVSLAGLQDLVSRRISNLFPLVLILLFLFAGSETGWRADVWQNIASFALIFVAGCALFRFRLLGGGDVKLWAAAALWFKLSQLPLLILSITLAGGALAILALARRALANRRRMEAGSPANWKAARSVPYGVAIALGTVVTISIAGAGLKHSYTSDPGYQKLNESLMETVSP